MSFEVKNDHISKELEGEIAAAIRERRSVAHLLAEKNFAGTPESVKELAHILIKYMGANMAIEFIFSTGLASWDKYRGFLVDYWEEISISEKFKAKTNLVLGQSLYQHAQKDKGIIFIKKAVINSADVKTTLEIAQVVNHELENKAWIKEILIGAKEFAKSSDDYANIAKALIDLTKDEKEGKKTFQKAIDSAVSFPEFCAVASAILKSLNDREWAKKIFRTGLIKKDAGSTLHNIAEEEYKEVLRKTRNRKK